MTPDDNALPKGAVDEPVPMPDTAETDAVKRLSDQVAALTAESEQRRDQMLRALAEAENVRRRAERDREDATKYALTNFARQILTVADNLQRALAAIDPSQRETDEKIKNLTSGIEATERDLLATFERFGIKRVPALGVPFNPNLHEVMVEIPGTGKPGGTVVQVMEDGYTIHDRLLRPARVAIAKADTPNTHTFDEKA